MRFPRGRPTAAAVHFNAVTCWLDLLRVEIAQTICEAVWAVMSMTAPWTEVSAVGRWPLYFDRFGELLKVE